MKAVEFGYMRIALCLLATTITFSGLSANPSDFECQPEYIIYDGKAVPLSEIPISQWAALTPSRFEGDTLKVLVIPLEWNNRPSSYPKEVFDTLFFSDNIRPHGSVAEYFEEVSYGHLAVTGSVLDWYNAGTYIGGVCDPYFVAIIIAQLDPYVDYSQYDGNSDGFVDAVVVLHSGNAQQDSQDFTNDP